MLPLGDKEHLARIIFNTTVTTSQGSSYGGGGGGLCFNTVVPDGETSGRWGSKEIKYALGSSESVIEYDGTFNVMSLTEEGKSELLDGVSLDDYAEIQAVWWKYSEKDKDGADLDIKINSITLVYEYDESEQPETTTGSDDIVYGDANGDDFVSVADATLIMQSIANPTDYSIDEKNKAAADCQGGGDGITSGDALAIQKFLANSEMTLPTE